MAPAGRPRKGEDRLLLWNMLKEHSAVREQATKVLPA